MIKVTNLSKQFNEKTVVDDVSFSVKRGEVLGFLGPNGAGKSTTMKMISGFLNPDHGTVQIDGIDVVENPKAAKSIMGYLPEGMPLYGDMPVHSFLAFIGRIRGMRGAELSEKMAVVVSDVQIEEVITQPIATLSKGFRRRVGLAQALLHDPNHLILDEPTDGLDPNQKTQVRALIEKISETKAIVLSTHILEEVDAVCSRVIIIRDGRVVIDDTPNGLAASSMYHNAVYLKILGAETDSVESKLQSIEAVGKVEYSESDNSYRLTSKDGRSVIEDVSHLIEANGWKIRSLSEEKGDLNEVFRHFTS